VSINGPEIVTPAGTRTIGNYFRHTVSYKIPTSHPQAGQSVFMALQNENTVKITTGADAGSAAQAPVEVWHRCPPATSGLVSAPSLLEGEVGDAKRRRVGGHAAAAAETSRRWHSLPTLPLKRGGADSRVWQATL
jgi:hypothetical protein